MTSYTEQRTLREPVAFSAGFAYLASHEEVRRISDWQQCFVGHLKDHRYYDLIDETLTGSFETLYLVLENAAHQIRAIQPLFLQQQDLATGLGARTRTVIEGLRMCFPRFLTLKTLFVGCVAGAGHFSGAAEDVQWVAQALDEVLPVEAKKLKASLIVFKEFPLECRQELSRLTRNGYTRIASLPYVRLNLDFENFDEYMVRSLSQSRRKNFRRKFKKLHSVPPITMQVTNDLSPYVDEVYGLYLQVYERATVQFEKLTKDYLCRLGQYMPDRARFFIWRQNGKVIAFSVCLVQGEAISDEYVGFEYPTALDLHLYFCTTRDILEWAVQNGYKTYYSTSCAYDPKLHFGCKLVPLDIYVRHASSCINFFLRRLMPFLGPARRDPVLKAFPNSYEL